MTYKWGEQEKLLQEYKDRNGVLKTRTLKKYVRATKFLILYNKGKTLEQIGQMEGLTRERVRQILNMSSDFNPRMRGTPVTLKHILCDKCSKPMGRKIKLNQENPKGHFHTQCNPRYMGNDKDKINEKQRWRWKNDPLFKKNHNISIKKSFTKMKSDPKRYARHKKLQATYVKKYQERLRSLKSP